METKNITIETDEMSEDEIEEHQEIAAGEERVR